MSCQRIRNQMELEFDALSYWCAAQSARVDHRPRQSQCQPTDVLRTITESFCPSHIDQFPHSARFAGRRNIEILLVWENTDLMECWNMFVVNFLGETFVKNIYDSILLLKIHCCFNIAAEVDARVFYANWTGFPKCVQSSWSTCLSSVGWVEHQNHMRITPSQLRLLQNWCISAASADDLLKMFASAPYVPRDEKFESPWKA